MSESKRPSPKGGSGEHPAVKAYRDKLESISEHVSPELQNILERAEKLKTKSDKPPKDPRREDDDAVPVDVVELEEPDPFPSSKPPKGI